jgi:hypothetical protein
MIAALLLLSLLLSLTGHYRQAQAKGVTYLNGPRVTTSQENSSLAPWPGDESLGPVVSPIFTPTDISLSPTTVLENQPAGTLVGTFTTDDLDSGETYTYTLVSGAGDTGNASFTIPLGTNELRTAVIFDREAQSSYSIRVRSTGDTDGFYREEPFTITIGNVNDVTPSDINLSGTSVAENQPVNTVVGTLSTTDADSPDSHTYSFAPGGADNSQFNINGNQLRTSFMFNFEVDNSYNIRIRTTDSGGLFFDEDFTITVTNVNEPPSDITLSPTSVAEGQPIGTLVGTLGVTDPDSGNTHTFSFAPGGPDNGSFTISANQLRTNAIFNFEADNSYSIRVRVTDNGGLFREEDFTITITNVNEAPTDISLTSTNIAENRPINTVVGTFSTTDPDNPGAGQTHTYTLVSAPGCTDSAQFNINGNQLRTSAIFDYQADNSYCIRVRTTDNGAGNLFYEEQFTINVTDVIPTISVTKTANPTSVPETGANVTFTIRITPSQENATLVAFSDSDFNLNTRCPDWPNKFIASGQAYTCVFTEFISGDYPGNHQNIVTVNVQDNENHVVPGVGTATVTFTDVQPNLSVAYTPNPASVFEPGGNVIFSVLVTNLSTEAGTLTQLQDSTFGNLNGQGSCTLNGTVAPSGGMYNCSFSKLVSGTSGQTLVYTATARLSDDDGNNKSVSDNASVFVGEMLKTYLPLIITPVPTDLFIDNDTGGPVTFTVVEAGVSCNVPTGDQNFFCGSFLPGTYTVQVNSICGNLTASKTYNSGPQTTRVFCN